MSMELLTILQFSGIMLCYSALTLLLPAVMFCRVLQGRKVAEQFLFCFTFGNFYIINLVFLLQLLHISNRVTLIALTFVLSVFIWSRVQNVSLKHTAVKIGVSNRKVIQGKLGIRTALRNIMRRIRRQAHAVWQYIYRGMICKPFQWLFLCALLFALFWIYGRQLVLVYGYCASDIPVHMDWINQMSRGNLFSDGVYPFGFHCVIYYLHEVFGFDVYVILCKFFFVQVIFAHLVLLALLKQLCRLKYLPYIGVIVYAVGSFWMKGTYFRYFSSLPQEFGMIFVIPSIYFLIRFFQTPREQLRGRETKLVLGSFVMAFSLTLAIHFYGTIIAGICCVGIAAGFFRRFMNRNYLKRILLSGILSVFLALLPMGIAYAAGTPLQGSLGWGMSVITGASQEETADATEAPDTEMPQISQVNSDTAGQSVTNRMISSVNKENETDAVSVLPGQVQSVQKSAGGITEKVAKAVAVFAKDIRSYIFETSLENLGYGVLVGIGALLFLGLLFCLLKRVEYGASLLAYGYCMVLLTVLLCSGDLGLPQLMNEARSCVYYAYLLMGVPVLLLDGIVYLLFMHPRIRVLGNVITCMFSFLVIVGMYHENLVKHPEYSSDFVTNGAITCMENIIYERKDATWTIISANDEGQIGLDHGWHMESIDLLRNMEYMSAKTRITIPTEYVYVFIEKIPVNYAEEYAESGQSISAKGASQPLPYVGGLSAYKGENRWIIMSKLYSWAEAFQKKYPEEMQVYYESENFICYQIYQNPEHVYNLAIDYGCNQVIAQ